MRKEFAPEQIERLKANKNVLKCTPKIITFTEEFKTLAVKKYSEGFTPIGIFREAGISIELMGKQNPKKCIHEWRRQLKTKGHLKNMRGKYSKGGGRKLKEKIPKDEKEKIKYLEAKVAYLEKENAFLAELRAKRRAEE